MGLPFDVLTSMEAAEAATRAVAARRRCFVSTPNLNFVVACRGDAAFRLSVLRSDLSLADGMPLVWVARAIGAPIRERVAGSSLFERLRMAGGSRRIYFFGGPEGIAERACLQLNADKGSMVCVGWQSPGFGTVAQMSSREAIDAINATDADFLVVALGARKGQEWILANLDRLTIPLISHLGAVVNFVAGTVSRAPERWQRLGLEWLWRIRQEPHLWKRYASDGLAFLRMLTNSVLPIVVDGRLHRPSTADLDAARVEVARHAGETVITLGGAWTALNIGHLYDAFESAVEEQADIVLDVAALTFFDSACAGTLMLLQGHQACIGRALDIRSAGRATRARLRRHRVAFT